MRDDGGDRINARLLREELTRRIRDLADQGKIYFSDHAFERMEERGIDALTSKRVLQRGDIDGEPQEGEGKDEWIVTVVDRIKPNRDAGVVAVVVGKKALRVITVKWVDL